MAIWTKRSGTKLAVLQERITTTVDLPVDANATITLISGSLPKGMRLSGSTVFGTPLEVPRNTIYRFVLRAVLNGVTEDRTFNIEVQGADEPIWVTPEDLLPIGNNEAFYILDSAPVDYQLSVIDRDRSAGQRLRFFIANGDGELPPGITLTEEGRLIGVVDPVLALDRESGSGLFDETSFDKYPFDFSIKSSQGFDSFFYDLVRYDISTPTRTPKKLNRYYQFRVSVSDGDTIAQRTFRIYVVGDDFLRSDNTIMQVGTGIFTADNTHIRTPIWLTPSDLGFRRANNYVTLFLDVIDPNSLTGLVVYSVVDDNPDGSPSILPPGLSLDSETGEILGRVPYQPAVTRRYQFTIRATRITANTTEQATADKTFTVRLLGEIESVIAWNTDPDLGNIASNYVSTLSVSATTTVPNANILYTLIDGRLPPGLSLAFDGEIVGKINSFGTPSNLGLTVFDNATTKFDGNTTTIDREYKFTVKAQDKFGFSAIEREFTIKVEDPGDKLYSNVYFNPLLKLNQRISYREFVGNPEIFNPESVYRPNDPNFGLQQDIKMLVYAGIETLQADRYVAAASRTTRRKNLKIKDLKTAVAKTPGTNDVVYEVVYLEVTDPYEKNGDVRESIKITNNDKILVNSILATPGNPYYDNLIRSNLVIGTRANADNTKYFDDFIEIVTRDAGTLKWYYGTEVFVQDRTNGNNIQVSFTQGSSTNIVNRPYPENTVKADSTAVKVSDPNKIVKYISNISNIRKSLRLSGDTERNYLPLWMRTAQENSIQELGYTLAIPLAYCKPGTSKTIKAAIEFSGFDYRQFELDVDRFLIDSTEGIGDPKFFVFHNYEFNI